MKVKQDEKLKHKPYKIIYHCFGNNWDEYFETEQEARLFISDRIKEGERDLRIYTNTYEDEQDYLIGDFYEWGIYFLGEFPL